MRLIDADKFKSILIDKLETNKKMVEIFEELNLSNKAYLFKGKVKTIEDIIEKLDNQPTVNEWIPCSERLPERERGELPKPYLVCTNRGGCAIARYDGRWRVSGSVKVIAYMPLPEPYKGE